MSLTREWNGLTGGVVLYQRSLYQLLDPALGGEVKGLPIALHASWGSLSGRLSTATGGSPETRAGARIRGQEIFSEI